MQFVKELAEGTVHKSVLFSPHYVSDVEIQRDGVHC